MKARKGNLKSGFGILKGIGPFTKEDEYNICVNLEKKHFKGKKIRLPRRRTKH